MYLYFVRQNDTWRAYSYLKTLTLDTDNSLKCMYFLERRKMASSTLVDQVLLHGLSCRLYLKRHAEIMFHPTEGK